MRMLRPKEIVLPLLLAASTGCWNRQNLSQMSSCKGFDSPQIQLRVVRSGIPVTTAKVVARFEAHGVTKDVPITWDADQKRYVGRPVGGLREFRYVVETSEGDTLSTPSFKHREDTHCGAKNIWEDVIELN